MEDLAPEFPLPGPGDYVLVLVSGASAAPGLVAGWSRLAWCLVTDVRLGPDDLYPVIVELPGGAVGAYQQHEIRGWHPARRRRTWLQRLGVR
jgi:hypothetical protein